MLVLFWQIFEGCWVDIVDMVGEMVMVRSKLSRRITGGICEPGVLTVELAEQFQKILVDD
jgi:hypothetical protein